MLLSVVLCYFLTAILHCAVNRISIANTSIITIMVIKYQVS